MYISVSKIKFDDLFEKEKILNAIAPEGITGPLNAMFRLKADSIVLALKDSSSFVELKIPATMTFKGKQEDVGVLLEFQKLSYILHSYTNEELAELELQIDTADPGKTSSVTLSVKKDKIKLPHIIASSDLLEEYDDLHDNLSYTAKKEDFVWSDFDTELQDEVLEGITYSLQFVSPDEQKNNALALYKDRIIVNDRRHVYIHKFVSSNLKGPVFDTYEMIPLHKKIARTFFLSAFRKSDTEFIVKTGDGEFKDIYIRSGNFECRLNNALSNLAPPSAADLEKIAPTAGSFDIESNKLMETAKFFSGLYSSSSSSDWNPIALGSSSNKDELEVSLKDSGVVGYNSCSVDRAISITGCSIKDPFSVQIINDSLKTFLASIAAEIVTVSIPKDEPAVHIATDKSEIYLVKLV